MSDEQHLKELKEIRQDRLKEIEKQIAAFGDEFAPPHLLVEAAKLRNEIGIVDVVASAPISSSISDDLKSSGRFQAYYEQYRLINQSVAHLGKELDKFVEGSLIWRKEIKSWLIVIFIALFILSMSVVGVVVYLLTTR